MDFLGQKKYSIFFYMILWITQVMTLNSAKVSAVVLEESFAGALGPQKDWQVGPRSTQAWTLSRGKNVKTQAVLLWAHQNKAGFSGKDNNAGKGGKEEDSIQDGLTP